MQHVGLRDILIDDVTWSCATRARRAEWQQTIAELVEEGRFQRAQGGAGEQPPLRAYVTVHKTGIAVALHDQRGHQVERAELSEQAIAPLIAEYMKIVRDMVRSGRSRNSPQLEALDIAKRLTHDDGAEVLQQHFREICPDHPTARRLFTLLVVLTHDTTRLGPIRS